MRLNLSSFLQWRINIFLCQILGWRIIFYYITFLGKLYFFFNRKEKFKIQKAVQDVFSYHKHYSEITSITKDVFRGILSHYFEKFLNAFSSQSVLSNFVGFNIAGEGMSALDQGLVKGKGVLLITGHFGGVELIPAFLGANNYPATIVARFSSNSLRQKSLQQASNFSVKIIDNDHTPNIMKAVFKELKENRIVIMQCDEIDEWKPCRNHQTFFLGKPVQLDRTISIMTKRCKAAVVFGVMHRGYHHSYKFVATSWKEMAKRFQRTTCTTIGEVVLKFMEQYIYKFPEEWYQWKKYPALDIFAPADMKVEAPSALPLLQPSFGNI